MERAQKLMVAGGEKIRWQAAVLLITTLQIWLEIVGIAAGAVAYLGPFTAPFRNALIEEWVATTRTLNVPDGDDLKQRPYRSIEVREWTMMMSLQIVFQLKMVFLLPEEGGGHL